MAPIAQPPDIADIPPTMVAAEGIEPSRAKPEAF